MNRSGRLSVLTIGHSTHSYERFVEMLRGAGVTAVADVRSAPYSRRYPHFNSDTLRQELSLDRIRYSFLGKELGGRPVGAQFYCDGVADYEKMARNEEFSKGLIRVVEGAHKYRIAVMCSEYDPLDCHRCLLVGRALYERDIEVKHIVSDGRMIEQSEIELKLLQMAGLKNDDMFEPLELRVASAYKQRARKVAFAEPRNRGRDTVAAE
jgi:uncharacterized protein (DUF488 family)